MDKPIVPAPQGTVWFVLPEGADEPTTDPQVLAQAGTNGTADACIGGTGGGEEVPSGVLLSPALGPARAGNGTCAAGRGIPYHSVDPGGTVRRLQPPVT